jgi:hypothetical protein
MSVEYVLLLVVMAILLIGRIVSDRIQDQHRWFYFYEQQKMIAPTPRMIMIWQELPVLYQSVFPQQEHLPYMLYIPGSPSVLSPRKEVLIVLHDDRLTLYEGDPGSGQEIVFDDILFLEHGKMLFSFWLRIVCQHQTYTIQYNTKGDDAFAWMIKRIRLQSSQAAQPVVTPNDDRERTQLDWLANTHYPLTLRR